MTFGSPVWLWGLLLIPVLAAVFGWNQRAGARMIAKVVAPRLRQRLAGSVSRGARTFRFVLLLIGVAALTVSLAKPRAGYEWEESRRKGLDILFAFDVSRSMLANDIEPNRLSRAKLAAQDVIRVLEAHRLGLVAFAGSAFLQAPLTIDYPAVLESLQDLNTETIPRGGTNIAEAIKVAMDAFGKGEGTNRAMIIFTDGEELEASGVDAAKKAAEQNVRIFTVGVGTAAGSVIPLISRNNGGTDFVKDSKGDIVRSRLDEDRLRQIAEATGGFYARIDAPNLAKVLREGLGQMTAQEIDARLSRKPIERYQWPLGLVVFCLISAMLINDRRNLPQAPATRPTRKAVAAAALLLLSSLPLFGAEDGLSLYRAGKYKEAFEAYQQQESRRPDSDKLAFNSAAAYKTGEFEKAFQEFSKALTSERAVLQEKSHYNLGNTLYQRGELQKAPETKLKDWNDAVEHYDSALKLSPDDADAKHNREFVLAKIEELKKQQEQEKKQEEQQQQQDKDKDKDKKEQDQKDKDQQQKEQDKKDQQDQSGKDQEKQDQQGDKSDQQKQDGEKQDQQDKEGQGDKQENKDQKDQQKSGGKEDGQKQDAKQQDGSETSKDQQQSQGNPDQQNGQQNPQQPPPDQPDRKLEGDIKAGADQQQKQQQEAEAQLAEEQAAAEGKMTQAQAMALLESMRNEEQRVQLMKQRRTDRVYNDW